MHTHLASKSPTVLSQTKKSGPEALVHHRQMFRVR
jgi:hypothetical protein